MNPQGSASPWTWLTDFDVGMCASPKEREYLWSSTDTHRGQWLRKGEEPLIYEKLGDSVAHSVVSGFKPVWVWTGLSPETVWLGGLGQVFFPLRSSISSFGEGYTHLPGLLWGLDEMRWMRCLAMSDARWGQSSWEYHCYYCNCAQKSGLYMPTEESSWYCGMGDFGG